MIDLTQLHIDQLLGAGSQGKVFLATDPQGARFTVKLMVVDERLDRNLLYERAARFRADLLDRSMVPILSYGMVSATPPELSRQLGKLSKDALVLVMPFVAGATLDEIEASQKLTLGQGVAVLAGVASALARLPRDVAHGDVRAPNVFIRPNGEVALTDPDLSTPDPDPADDVRALAAIASSIARIAAPVDDALAVKQLEKLFDEIAIPRSEMTPAEAAQQFGEIAVLLGAPAGNVSSVLAALVREAERKRVEAGSRPTPAAERRRLGRWMVGAIAGALVIVGAAVWLWVQRTRGPLASTLSPSAGGRVSLTAGPAGGEGVGSVRKEDGKAADGLYDTTGTVRYDEPIHRLGPSEKVAAKDGMVQIEFEDSIPRVAILSPRKEILWEVRSPPAGGSVYLDAKPGHYYVEQDRNLAHAGNQQDLKLVEIDLQHPLRVTTTKEILNAPQRPRQVGKKGP